MDLEMNCVSLCRKITSGGQRFPIKCDITQYYYFRCRPFFAVITISYRSLHAQSNLQRQHAHTFDARSIIICVVTRTFVALIHTPAAAAASVHRVCCARTMCFAILGIIIPLYTVYAVIILLYTRIGLSHRIYGFRKSATDCGSRSSPGPAPRSLAPFIRRRTRRN